MGGCLSSFTSKSSYFDALILTKTSVSLATIYILMNFSRVYIRKKFLIGPIVFKYIFNMAKTA
jgi:hypothetical protein